MDEFFDGVASIIEGEQGGDARAEYGRGLLAELSEYLTGRFDNGFSETNLKYCRQFYTVYEPSIRQTLSDESGNRKQQAIEAQKSQTLSGEFITSIIPTGSGMTENVAYPFKLS